MDTVHHAPTFIYLCGRGIIRLHASHVLFACFCLVEMMLIGGVILYHKVSDEVPATNRTQLPSLHALPNGRVPRASVYGVHHDVARNERMCVFAACARSRESRQLQQHSRNEAAALPALPNSTAFSHPP